MFKIQVNDLRINPNKRVDLYVCTYILYLCVPLDVYK